MRVIPALLAHFDAKRRNEKPIAIGLTPPSFLLRFMRQPPNKLSILPLGSDLPGPGSQTVSEGIQNPNPIHGKK
jgi:hypothetical protein